MEVILLEKVANLGNLGDKVNIKGGYARNFLLPHGITSGTVPATAPCPLFFPLFLFLASSL